MVAAAAVAGEAAPPAAAERNADGFLVHRLESSLQAGATTVRVLLPDRMKPERRYPVLYVLPVEAGDGRRYGDGLVECKGRDLQNRHEVICVAPTFAHLPWFADHSSDPQLKQETYFVTTVVPLVDRTYPTIAESRGRWLVGFSKSGWGAFSLLLRHPDTFDRAAAWDAPLMKQRPDQFGMAPIFGTQENFEHYRIAGLLKREAVRFREGPRIFHLGYGNFRDHHEQWEELLAELQVSHHYRDGPHRAHNWHSGWLPEAVDMLAHPLPADVARAKQH